MENLALEGRFDLVSEETLPRASQMTQRPDQFNFPNIARTRQALRAPAVPAAKPARSAGRRFVEYAHIANDLSTPAQIMAAMRNVVSAGASADMTETERRVAAIWSDLLRRPDVRRSDNFYDLGGHSLL